MAERRGITVAKQANEFEKSEPNPNLPSMRGLPIGWMMLLAAATTVWAQDEPAMKGPGELILPQDPPKSVPRVLDRATTESTSIVVSLGRQRVYLYVDGEMAIDAPASTGKRRGQTPTGEFVVQDKAASHETHLHGDFVDRDGNAVRHGVSTRIDAAPSGTTFRAVPVQYYLRLNDEGLSLHAGRLPGYPASDTAVRLPADIAPLIFQRVKQGTPVKIEE
jgi:lipoprotein-anchoring transpeptidase ErfK/SrfK